jgi:hypothetical protein
MRLSLPLVFAIATLTLPMVSGCSKKEAPPVEVTLKQYSSMENGFTVDMPEPHLEKSTEVGRCYYFNCPDGSYKVFVKPMRLPDVTNAERPVRDKNEIESLSGHAGSYVDATFPGENKKFTYNFKYLAFDEKGSTNSSGGGADGKRHLGIRFADNDVIVNDQGAYHVQGVVGDNANYVLAVEGKPEFVNSPTVQQFFDSLKIIGKANIQE